MPGFLEQFPFVVELGPWALVAIFVLMVWTGRLVPKRLYDEQVHEKQEWRTESRINDQTIAELTKQNAVLLDGVGKTVESVLGALPSTAETQEKP